MVDIEPTFKDMKPALYFSHFSYIYEIYRKYLANGAERVQVSRLKINVPLRERGVQNALK